MIETDAIYHRLPPPPAVTEHEVAGLGRELLGSSAAGRVGVDLAQAHMATEFWSWVEPTTMLRRALVRDYYTRLAQLACMLEAVKTTSCQGAGYLLEFECDAGALPGYITDLGDGLYATPAARSRLEQFETARAALFPQDRPYVEIAVLIDPDHSLITSCRRDVSLYATVVGPSVPRVLEGAGFAVAGRVSVEGGPEVIGLRLEPCLPRGQPNYATAVP